MKRKVFLVLLILCMVIIFLFSNQNAYESKKVSDNVAIKILEIKSGLEKKKISEEDKQIFIKNTRTIIRKSAHFIIYFILGIVLLKTLKIYNIKHVYFYAILFSFLYACSDEVHQYFISERTAKFLDVFIDTVGSSLGVLLEYLITKKRN